MKLHAPKMLHEGSTIAVVSPSWGGPYDEPERYERAKDVLSALFNIRVIDMPHTKHAPAYLQKNPQARANDLIQAFEDSRIDGVIASIGGFDSLELYPYLDLEVLRANPKVFMGFSDTTCVHFMCHKAGISSFYGPSILANFGMDPLVNYTVGEVRDILFDAPVYRNIPFFKGDDIQRTVMQGEGLAQGHLIGGCIETFPHLMQTPLWPEPEYFDNAILFFETVPKVTSRDKFRTYVRSLGAAGIYDRISCILFGRVGSYDSVDKYAHEYNEVLQKVVCEEFGRPDLGIITNAEFGHTQPMTVLPYGARMEINLDDGQMCLLGPVVQPV